MPVRVTESTPRASVFDALLPLDLWHEVAPFLTGWELFSVMRVSRAAHTLFSQPTWWTPCAIANQVATTTSAPVSAARSYADQHSFAFEIHDDPAVAAQHSKRKRKRTSPQIGLTPAFSIPLLFGRTVQTFSIEIWFALPKTAATHGGILLGAGTPFHLSPSWNPLFETWLHVDEQRNLYGSLITAALEGGGADAATPLAQNLDCDCWHHLVMAFEARTDVAARVRDAERDQRRVYGEERVYVNGALAAIRRGGLSRFWIFNSFVLLGTGCSSSSVLSPHTPQRQQQPITSTSGVDTKATQWYPFKGVVDDMRVWHSILTPHDITAVAHIHDSARSNQLHEPAPGPLPVHSWKKLAAGAAPLRLQDHSFKFRGSHDSRPHSRGVSVNVANHHNFQRGLTEHRLEFHPFCPDASSSFALEVWFCLHREDTENWGGSVILGAQSRCLEDAYSPAHTRPLVFVDRQGRLFASVLDELLVPSALRLKPQRWYHLLLRYQDGKQAVFLNGIRRRSSAGALLRDWHALSHMQVGTGCLHALARGAPTPTFKGWYSFHGRIREVRIYGPRLKHRQFATILNSRRATASHVPEISHLQPVFSLQRDGRLPHCVGVQNSRPWERVFVARPIDMKPTEQLKPQDPIQSKSLSGALSVHFLTSTRQHTTAPTPPLSVAAHDVASSDRIGIALILA